MLSSCGLLFIFVWFFSFSIVLSMLFITLFSELIIPFSAVYPILGCFELVYPCCCVVLILRHFSRSLNQPSHLCYFTISSLSSGFIHVFGTLFGSMKHLWEFPLLPQVFRFLLGQNFCPLNTSFSFVFLLLLSRVLLGGCVFLLALLVLGHHPPRSALYYLH